MNKNLERMVNIDEESALDDAFEVVARKRGVRVYPLDINKINPMQSVRLKCQVPLCEYYEVCKVCPPNIPSVREFREALESYSTAYLVVLREKTDNIDRYREDFSAELRLAEIVSELELTAFQHGYYLALGLCVGGCKLCEKCAPPGEACRHPFKARASPEGFGIDITGLAREAVSFLGLVLI